MVVGEMDGILLIMALVECTTPGLDTIVSTDTVECTDMVECMVTVECTDMVDIMVTVITMGMEVLEDIGEMDITNPVLLMTKTAEEIIHIPQQIQG